jgi:Autographiviridae endonuclease VII
MFSYSEWARKRYAENPEYREKRRASHRRYRQAHKEELRERRRRKWETDPEYRERRRARDREAQRKQRFKKVYGISLADYDMMFARQGGACAICKRADRTLCVDHCHVTGKVRGLLCAKCNSALGFCNDDPGHLLAAAAYLRAFRDREHPRVTEGRADRSRNVSRPNGRKARTRERASGSRSTGRPAPRRLSPCHPTQGCAVSRTGGLTPGPLAGDGPSQSSKGPTRRHAGEPQPPCARSICPSGRQRAVGAGS